MRMRPLNTDKDDGDPTVQKVSNDSLAINGHNFTFDSVADTGATQVWLLFLVLLNTSVVVLCCFILSMFLKKWSCDCNCPRFPTILRIVAKLQL